MSVLLFPLVDLFPVLRVSDLSPCFYCYFCLGLVPFFPFCFFGWFPFAFLLSVQFTSVVSHSVLLASSYPSFGRFDFLASRVRAAQALVWRLGLIFLFASWAGSLIRWFDAPCAWYAAIGLVQGLLFMGSFVGWYSSALLCLVSLRFLGIAFGLASLVLVSVSRESSWRLSFFSARCRISVGSCRVHSFPRPEARWRFRFGGFTSISLTSLLLIY